MGSLRKAFSAIRRNAIKNRIVKEPKGRGLTRAPLGQIKRLKRFSIKSLFWGMRPLAFAQSANASVKTRSESFCQSIGQVKYRNARPTDKRAMAIRK